MTVYQESLKASKGTISTESFLQFLQKQMFPPDALFLFFKGRNYIFQEDNVKLYTASLTKGGFVVEVSGC